MGEGSARVLDQAALSRLRGLALASRDAGLLSRLMGLFIQDTEARLAEMHSAVERREDTTLRAIAHTVRGAAATMGASEIVDLCSELERLPRRWSAARTMRAEEALHTAFQRARAALELFVSEVEETLASG